MRSPGGDDRGRGEERPVQLVRRGQEEVEGSGAGARLGEVLDGEPWRVEQRVPSGVRRDPAPPTKSTRAPGGVVDEVLNGGQPRFVASAGAARTGGRHHDVVAGGGDRDGGLVGEVAGGGEGTVGSGAPLRV